MTAFTNGLTKVVVGNSATTTIQFIVPSEFLNLASGYVTYFLIDSVGAVYSTGLGANYTVTPISVGSRVTADLSITVPANIPVNEIGTNYQVKVLLTLPDEDNSEFAIFDTLVVLPSASVALGAEDSVELYGSNVSLKLVVEESLATAPTCDVYFGNVPLINSIVSTGPVALADGYEYAVGFLAQNNGIMPSLIPYNTVWNYEISGINQSESSNLYVITPSIMQAMKDIYVIINKSRAKFGYQSVFNETEILSYLRQGADLFNGMFNPTVFTMTNAIGPVRHFWLQCSAIIALRSQYLMEGESAFNFSGQSVSLDIDRSQYYESLASTLESSMQEPARQLKANLAKRGQISGDGSVNPLNLAVNAIGTIGISASQVSNMRNVGLNALLQGLRF